MSRAFIRQRTENRDVRRKLDMVFREEPEIKVKVPTNVSLPQGFPPVEITKEGMEKLQRMASSANLYYERDIHSRLLANILLNLHREASSGKECLDRLGKAVFSGDTEAIDQKINILNRWIYEDPLCRVDRDLLLCNPTPQNYEYIIREIKSDQDNGLPCSCASVANRFCGKISRFEKEGRFVGYRKPLFLIKELVNSGAVTILPETWPLERAPDDNMPDKPVERAVFKDMHGSNKKFAEGKTYGLLFVDDVPQAIKEESEKRDYMDRWVLKALRDGKVSIEELGTSFKTNTLEGIWKNLEIEYAKSDMSRRSSDGHIKDRQLESGRYERIVLKDMKKIVGSYLAVHAILEALGYTRTKLNKKRDALLDTERVFDDFSETTDSEEMAVNSIVNHIVDDTVDSIVSYRGESGASWSPKSFEKLNKAMGYRWTRESLKFLKRATDFIRSSPPNMFPNISKEEFDELENKIRIVEEAKAGSEEIKYKMPAIVPIQYYLFLGELYERGITFSRGSGQTVSVLKPEDFGERMATISLTERGEKAYDQREPSAGPLIPHLEFDSNHYVE